MNAAEIQRELATAEKTDAPLSKKLLSAIAAASKLLKQPKPRTGRPKQEPYYLRQLRWCVADAEERVTRSEERLQNAEQAYAEALQAVTGSARLPPAKENLGLARVLLKAAQENLKKHQLALSDALAALPAAT